MILLPYTAVAALFVIAVIDVRTQKIPDSLNLLLLLFGVIAVFMRGGLDIFGLALGIGVIGGQWLISRGKAMGSGDVFLMIGISLLLPQLSFMILTLLVAYISAACVALFLLLTGRMKMAGRMPFAPFLVLGAATAILFGGTITTKFGT
ncbi:prepilin peptidase [Candidatus Peregrinibacteria bacterium]|nr:prepilin peptidase [Candidatus Peregrinibacteria bacterium]